MVTNAVRFNVMFEHIWAVRPSLGNTLGNNFMGPYKDEVRAMVERGRAERGKKMSTSQMHEQLFLSHSSRHEIPSVHNISSHVNFCLRKIIATEKQAAVETNAGQYKAAAEKGAAEKQVADGLQQSVRIGEQGRETVDHATLGATDRLEGHAGTNTAWRSSAQDLTKESGVCADSSMEAITVDCRNVETGAMEAGENGSNRYSMPLKYGKVIEQIVRTDPTVKPRFVPEKLLHSLGIRATNKPTDLPSTHQIARKVASIKSKMEKEKSSLST